MIDLDRLNADCTCTTLDRERLAAALAEHIGDAGVAQRLLVEKPTLFAPTPIYLAASHVDTIIHSVTALDALMRTPAWRAAALEMTATPLASIVRGTTGVFMGYDFHIGAAGPQLIEINTNAGGALVNAMLLAAQRACCSAMDGVRPLAPPPSEIEARFVETFRDGRLWTGATAIDLVYNRHTDFALTGSELAALRDAFAADAVVLTPDPHAHASQADKRLFTVLCDRGWLEQIGLPPQQAAAIAALVTVTQLVRCEQAEALWAARKRLFFKPVTGYGGKAAYRGDKLTRAVFAQVLAGTYVSQAMVPPSTRVSVIDGIRHTLKLDVRAYACRGHVLLLAARLYQGQITNFRKHGGGWAPVFGAVTTP